MLVLWFCMRDPKALDLAVLKLGTTGIMGRLNFSCVTFGKVSGYLGRAQCIERNRNGPN